MGGSYLNEERTFQAEGLAEETAKARTACSDVEAMLRLLLLVLSAMVSL